MQRKNKLNPIGDTPGIRKAAPTGPEAAAPGHKPGSRSGESRTGGHSISNL